MIKFGTAGFREIIGELFTKENVQKITQALAIKIKKEKSDKPVAIGFDKRFLSDRAAVWVAEVLAGNKIKVKLYNRETPTPSVMYTVLTEDLDYGVMITASHNPHFHNGVKIIEKGGRDASVETTDMITKLANKNLRIKTLDINEGRAKGLVEDLDNLGKYIKNIQKYVSNNLKDSDIKVLFNPMHGATTESARLLAKNYNLKNFDIINDNEDAYFEHKLPSPSEEVLEDFKLAVKKGKYAIGLACDGDGDRLGVVDEKGNYYSANTTLAVVYYYLIKYRNLKGDIVKNLSTSYAVDLVAEKLGFKCHETSIGFKWIVAKMEETDSILGGESSGGLTMKGYLKCKDSCFAISLILDAMATIKKPLSKIVKEVYDFCGYNSIYVEKSQRIKNKKKLIKALQTTRPNFDKDPVKVSQQDGVKYYFADNSFVHIRFSGTEDLLRYHMEFPNATMCDRAKNDILDYISKFEK